LKDDLRKISGFIPEDEIDDLVSKDDNITGATGPILDTIAITATTIAMTFGMNFCPTSACTGSC